MTQEQSQDIKNIFYKTIKTHTHEFRTIQTRGY